MTGKRSKRAAGALPRQPWRVHFFQRHPADDPAQAVPARAFLDSSPIKVSATMIAVVRAVADAPPPAFSGGGKWEAMHGKMSGIYEVRGRRAQPSPLQACSAFSRGRALNSDLGGQASF
jgi:hypothetical protein